MIEFIEINKKYGRTPVLNSINLELEQNKSYALLGPNGSGKTTLIKTILGMVIPTSGAVQIMGKNIGKTHDYRKFIGYMPQIGQYPANMTVGHVFNMMKDIRKEQEYMFDDELMESFKIGAFWDKRTSALSGGTRQKLSACLAFLFNPSVLILDEPTAGLDPVSSEILKEKIVKEINRNKLVIITSHILSDLDEIITDIIYLHEGRIVLNKSLQNLKSDTGEMAVSKIIPKLLKENVLV